VRTVGELRGFVRLKLAGLRGRAASESSA
jgi:hypothetical protein